MDYEVEMKKNFNEIIRKSRESSKLDYCLCCGKKVTSFCNSHSLPECILRSISNNGMVFTSNKYFKAPLIKEIEGLNRSGTFKRICHKCDNNIFQDYEDSKKLEQEPRKKMMTEIDLKNSLRMYDKRLNEIELYREMLTMLFDKEAAFQILDRQRVNHVDLNEIKNELDRDIKILNKESSSSFELIYWKKLDYVTPIAFQGHMALQGDLNGNVINDLYNPSSDYVIENINVCVFPLEHKTIVMLFVSKDNKKYRNFIAQFKKLKEEEKLKLISFLIFNYSEDFFVSQNSSKKILTNHVLDVVTRNVTDIIALDDEMVCSIQKLKNCELMYFKEFPNVLSEEYALLVRNNET